MALALHVNNTAPKFTDIYVPETYDVLSTVLSALLWKKYNGDIKLYADNKVYDFYKKNNLLDLWTDIDVSDFNTTNNIDHKVFWAASKFHAIANEEPPFFVMDTDFIVWNTIKNDLLNEKIIAIHDENINNSIYPSIENLNLTTKQISLLNNLNWNIKASNTAFTYFNDIQFKNTYLNLAFNFIENHRSTNSDKLIYMVLVEQRLFSMVADLLKIEVKYLINDKTMYNQKDYTHVWGLKQKLKNNKIIRMHFNSMCTKRIKREFPEYIERVEKTILALEWSKK